MIVGKVEQVIDVTPGYMGYINVVVHASVANQPPAAIKAILDTGFSGDLQMQPTQIAGLGLRYVGIAPMTLANGSKIPVSLYLATIDWDGTEREVVVQKSDGPPLLGMSLLWGHLLVVKAERDGPIILH